MGIGQNALAGLLVVAGTWGGAAVGPAGAVADSARSTRAMGGSSPSWPTSMCRKQRGHRFRTTTLGGSEHDIFADPAGSQRPRLSAAAAIQHFHKMYGETTPAQDRHTQVRFGRISYTGSGPVSDNVLGYVPDLRRTPAWLITNCVNPSSPKDYTNGNGQPRHYRGGRMFVIVKDTHKARAWLWEWNRNSKQSWIEMPTVRPYPRPRSTPYRSVPWQIAEFKHRRALLRYRAPKCFTFDHLNIERGNDTVYLAVIVSSGPDGSCPKRSATAPYVEVTHSAGDPPLRLLRHLRTGRVHFSPESAG